MCIVFLLWVAPVALAENNVDVFAEYGVVIDVESGEVLYGKQENAKAYPASLTKLMTAILLDEYVEDNETLEVSERATQTECSCLVLKAGDTLTKEDAMNALMIKSANDVTVVVAEHISGSEEDFALLMNKKAKELGLKNTSFVTSNGLHDENHYTTAYDMALIGRAAIATPAIIRAMKLENYEVELEDRKIPIQVVHQIHKQPHVIGGKTGYTSIAQNTLFELFEKDGKKMVGVVMKTTKSREYMDLNNMFTYAATVIKEKAIVKKNDIVGQEKIRGVDVNLIAQKSYDLFYKKGHEPVVQKKVVMEQNLDGYIHSGQEVGELHLSIDEKNVASIPLATDKAISIKEKDFNLWMILFGFFFPLLGYFIYERVRKKQV